MLLVDDDPFVCTNLASALRRVFPPETAIRTAHTLQEAKEWIAKEEFDGVIADRGLPDGSGTDLIRRLANRSSQRITLILISDQVTDLPDVAELLTEHQDVIFFEKPLRFTLTP